MRKKIISIANQKGGVGKTTTAINLAASLAAAERRTLLIDSDPQGNTSSGIGIDRSKIKEKNLYQAVIGNISLQDTLHGTSLPSLTVIPATQDLIGVEVEFVNLTDREHRMKHLLSQLPEEYEFIIIDCPPSLGFLTINALVASNSLIIPLQCEYFAMEGLSQLLNTVHLVQARLNPGLVIGGILLTMFDTRNRLSHRVEEEVRKYFGSQVFQTIIPRNVRLSESPSHGLPVLLYDVTSRGAVAYLELAKEILNNGGG